MMAALAGGAFGLAAGLACLLPGRATLDALLVPLATVIVLPAFLANLPPRTRLTATLAALACLALGVLPAAPSPATLAVLLAWAALLASPFVPANRPPRRNEHAAAAGAFVVVLFALAWLAWPIWLGPQLVAWEVAVPAWATTFHPLFAANAAAVERGVWTEQPAVYAITPLGQDLAYALPASPWPATLLMASVAAMVSAASFVRRARRMIEAPAS